MTLNAQKIILNEERNVQLTVMLQAVDGEFGAIHARPAILILPGGGYEMCSDREAEQVAYPYMAAGYHAFVLRYSVKEHKDWPNPLNDYEQAMQYIEDHADEWHVKTDKIVVAGFSAGGHLAACAATIAEHKPAAALLGYAAVNRQVTTFIQRGEELPAPVEQVDGNTCPCFLFAARDDSTVPIENTLDFAKALTEYDISYEVHIYNYGDHGFGPGTSSVLTTNACARLANWQPDSISWLSEMLGYDTFNGFVEPTCPGKVNGNREATLSAECTIGYLMTKEEASPVLDPFFQVVRQIGKARFNNEEVLFKVLTECKLRNLMIVAGQPEEAITAIDQALRQIPNN